MSLCFPASGHPVSPVLRLSGLVWPEPDLFRDQLPLNSQLQLERLHVCHCVAARVCASLAGIKHRRARSSGGSRSHSSALNRNFKTSPAMVMWHTLPTQVRLGRPRRSGLRLQWRRVFSDRLWTLEELVEQATDG